MSNTFPKRQSGASRHTLPELYNVRQCIAIFAVADR